MIRADADPETTMTNERGKLKRPMLWAGLALPAAAWTIHLSLSYGLATTACPDYHPPLLVLTVILLAVAGAGGWMAWTSWTAVRDDAHGASDRRALVRFLSLVGVLAAGFFTLAIFTQGIPIFILDHCL